MVVHGSSETMEKYDGKHGDDCLTPFLRHLSCLRRLLTAPGWGSRRRLYTIWWSTYLEPKIIYADTNVKVIEVVDLRPNLTNELDGRLECL